MILVTQYETLFFFFFEKEQPISHVDPRSFADFLDLLSN